MLRLLGIIVSIGLADSLDPTTVGPALYLSLRERPARQVIQFTLGILVVMLAGGLVMVLGPGQLLLHLIPRPSKTVEYWIEVGVGVALALGSLLIWRYRHPLARREIFVARETKQRSRLLLGIGVMAVNLPVAFPYFAAIAVIVASGRHLDVQVACIVLYSLCFIAPLLAISAILWLAPDASARVLDRVREVIRRHWAGSLALVLILAAAFVVALGLTGVASHDSGDLGRLAKHVHHDLT